jgi:hypothetical protein
MKEREETQMIGEGRVRWEREDKNVSKDPHASVLVRALVLISSYLSCYVHVEHLPRMLAWDAKLCDRLSRDRTTLQSDRQLLKSFGTISAILFWRIG